MLCQQVLHLDSNPGLPVQLSLTRAVSLSHCTRPVPRGHQRGKDGPNNPQGQRECSRSPRGWALTCWSTLRAWTGGSPVTGQLGHVTDSVWPWVDLVLLWAHVFGFTGRTWNAVPTWFPMLPGEVRLWGLAWAPTFPSLTAPRPDSCQDPAATSSRPLHATLTPQPPSHLHSANRSQVRLSHRGGQGFCLSFSFPPSRPLPSQATCPDPLQGPTEGAGAPAVSDV